MRKREIKTMTISKFEDMITLNNLEYDDGNPTGMRVSLHSGGALHIHCRNPGELRELATMCNQVADKLES